MSNLTEKPKADSKSVNLKRLLLFSGLGAIPIGIAVCFIYVPPSCACRDRGIDASGAYIRAQQAYSLEHKTFTSSYQSLGIKEIPTQTPLFNISTEVSKDKVVVYGTPRDVPTDLFRLGLTKAETRSFVNAAFYDKKSQTPISISCVSEKSTLEKPPTPAFNGEKLTCPVGFTSK